MNQRRSRFSYWVVGEDNASVDPGSDDDLVSGVACVEEAQRLLDPEHAAGSPRGCREGQHESVTRMIDLSSVVARDQQSDDVVVSGDDFGEPLVTQCLEHWG